MKEATGELSSSVIVLSLIAALAAFFFSVLSKNVSPRTSITPPPEPKSPFIKPDTIPIKISLNIRSPFLIFRKFQFIIQKNPRVILICL